MLKSIRNSFAPPSFEDAEQMQAATLLNSMLLTILGAAVVAFILAILVPASNPQDHSINYFLLGASGFAIAATLFLRWFMRRGFVQLVSGLLAFTLFLLVVLNFAQSDGLRSVGISGFVLVIVIAGLLLGTSGTILFSSLSLFGLFILYYLQSIDYIAQAAAPSNPLDWLIYVLVIVLGGLFMSIANRNINNAYQKNRESLLTVSETETALANADLETENVRQVLAERSNELERHTRYLEASATVTRTATTFQNPQQFLVRIANLISEQFGYYHTGIFLVDEDNEWAVLMAASSPGGQKMIARGHRLQVGKQGIVGFATGIGQPHIAQDIASDRVHTQTPELPDTKSEMALPLKVRGEIIGAIDIQDSQENAFTQDDVVVLQTLADQIALAVSNARLNQQAQENLIEMQKFYGEMSQSGWGEQHGLSNIYRFSHGQIQAQQNISALKLEDILSGEASNKNVIKLPIRVRGNTVGHIDIVRQTDDPTLTPEEKELMENLSDQLGVAMESARLFQESQRLAKDERLVSEVSARIRETLDIDTILQTAVDEIRQATGLPEVTIRLSADSPATFHDGNGSKSR